MEKLGFSNQWIQWIMACVTSVKYSVKFSGAILDSFTPSRGLHQGDPLSPFLFLFVVDGLSALLRQGVASNNIAPVKVCRRAPGVSHLLFADDTLLFFKANQEKAMCVKGVIQSYALATGQLINTQKCSIQFSDACPEEIQLQVRQILDVQK
uniref:Reverse transcriptase domain-containing protein n=1 Tax=Hordeum vulgare subsp. vulgare TaxID=112509 RepID=A0A8I6XXF5_HORVV